MPQVVIVSSLGPQGPVGPQGIQGLTGSMAESNSGSFAITGSLTVSGSSTFTNIGPAVFSGSSNFTSLTASSALISGDVTVLGTASINTLVVNQTQLSTGSNQLGDAANDTQTLYGTVRIPTGSLTVSGSSYFTGNVGIGTANPSFILDVVGNTRTNLTSFASQFKGDGGYANANAFSFSGNGNIGMYFPSNVNLGFSTSGSERMRIDASGNVGIGTTSPAYPLDVVGYIRSSQGYRFTPSSLGQFTISGGNTYFDYEGSFFLRGVPGYSNPLTVTAAGNVGIGTTTPTGRLHVKGNGTTSATTALLIENSNASASLTVLDNGYVGIGSTAPLRQLYVVGDIEVTNGIYGDATDHTFYTIASGSFHHRFYTRTSGGTSLERFTIQGGADTANTYFQNTNVGIGTTAPSVKLEIKATGSNETTQRWLDDAGNLLGDFAELGDAGVFRVGYAISAVSTARPLITLNGGTGNSSATIELRSKSSVTNIKIASDLPSYISGSNLALGFTSPTASAILHISGAAADNVFRVDTPSIPYALFVSGSGNVGIGTNNPVKALTLNANNLDDGFVIRSATNNTLFQVTKDGASNNTAEMFLYSGGSIRLAIRSTLNFSYFNGGNFGFGNSTDPGARLSIRGAGATSGTTALLVQNSNTSASLTVLDNGYVGINTANPLEALDVTGNFNTTGFIYRTGITGKRLFLYTSGNNEIVNLYDNSGITKVELRTNGSSYFNGGNVGIGTTAPLASLHISGSSGSVLLEVDSNSSQNILYVSGSGNVGIGTNAPTQKLDVDGAILVRAGNAVYFRDTTSYIYEGSGLNIVSGATRNIRLNAGGTDRFFVSSSGFVGIGTTTPIDLLNIRLNQNGTTQMRVENSNNDANSRASIAVGSAGDALTIARYLSNYVNSSWANRGGILTDSGLTNGFFFRTATGSISFEPVSIERMRITSEGNVGIGTSTPTTTLDIQSTSTGSIRISGSAGSQITFVRPTAGLTGFVRYTSTQMDIGTVGSDGLNLFTSNTSRVSIQTNGDVLIGAGSVPAGRLEVKGSGTTSSTISLRVGNSTPAPSLVITDDLTSRFYGNVGIGALPTSGSLHISGAASTSSAAVYIYKSGSTTLDIQGSQGQLFSVTDALSGSLMSVNDISGLPILEVFSDDRVVMGSFSQPALLVTGSAVRFPATASATPTYTGSEGQVVFGVVGGNAFMYVWLGGRWRSGSLA